MEWSAEIAALEMWDGLDLRETNGEVRAYFKRHLQDAFAAGYRKGCAAAECDDTNAST